MRRATRISRTQVLALPRSQPVAGEEWVLAAVAVALLLWGLVL